MSSELSGPHHHSTKQSPWLTDKEDIIHFLHGTTKENLNGRGDVTVTLYRRGGGGGGAQDRNEM